MSSLEERIAMIDFSDKENRFHARHMNVAVETTEQFLLCEPIDGGNKR